MIIEKLYKNLLDALKLVAAPADKQLDILHGYTKVPEEIMLIFTDAYISVPQLIVHNRVSEEVSAMIDELDKQFELMAEDKRLWTNEQLERSEAWKLSRETAMKVLKEMKEL